MIDLKAFRKANDIRQQELAEYLGIGQGFVSQMENGERPIPASVEEKILSNDRGWKTDYQKEVVHFQPVQIEGLSEVDFLRKEVEYLRELVKELRVEKAAYWSLIEKLSEK